VVTSLRIGENIKRLRNERGFTQTYIAEKLYISQQAVAKWEKGDTYPQADKVSDLAELFEVSVADLYDSDTVFDNKSIRIDITDFVEPLLKRIESVEYYHPDLSKLCEYVRSYAMDDLNSSDSRYYYNLTLDKVEYDAYSKLKYHDNINDRDFWKCIRHVEYDWYQTGSIYAQKGLQRYYDEISDPGEMIDVDLAWDWYIELFMA